MVDATVFCRLLPGTLQPARRANGTVVFEAAAEPTVQDVTDGLREQTLEAAVDDGGS